MKPEEVNAMTDDALWWKALRCLHGDKVLGGYSVHKESGRAWTQIDGEKVWREDCDYPNHISAAWELLDKWVEIGGTYEFAWGGIYCEANSGEIYENYVLLGTLALVKMGRGTNTAEETARAITKAFIIASEENHE